jgi:hypothetical protein
LLFGIKKSYICIFSLLKMYVFINKITQECYLSASKKVISKQSGVNYHSLVYYLRKHDYYENKVLIFIKGKVYKSKQGGKRIKNK